MNYNKYITIQLYDYTTIWLYDNMTMCLCVCMTMCLYDYMTMWLYDYVTIWLCDYLLPRPKQVLYTDSISASFLLMTSNFGKKETNLSSRAHR